ncbi:pyridoxal phosphate-dependent aminotransferase [Caldalkalibacillus salinus]|uniref:pyridoxal phosphate-dependent aminotransferase n=1 Tax=Caldalkalibacillus salinus TaxID=2803787 RepID=UPI001F3611B5|nr:pyridoxal phosphate-dependent aminotransferase [Caldalkalibacillus salinus]
MHKTISFKPADRMTDLPQQFFASLVANVQQKIDEGYDVINLGQGNPDQPTPTHIVQAMQEGAANPQYHRYAPFQGYSFLKEAIADYYLKEYGVQLDPEEEVAILFGGKSGLIEVSQCLLNPGDTCLVPDPGYPDYLSGIALAGAHIATMPLREVNAFLPDYDDIDPQTKASAKLMFLNYPNNPTTGVANEAFFRQTVDMAYDHNIAVVHDFAYGAIGFDGHKPVSLLQTPGAKEVGVEIYTMSKTYNMAGWRVGFALGNRHMIHLINKIQDHQFVSLFGAVQHASAVALKSDQTCVDELVYMYHKRREALYAELDRIGWGARRPAGSFFAWVPVPHGYSSTSFANLLLEEAHIAVAPGIGFGSWGDAYVRVGLLTEEARLVEAVRRIERLQL